jgi:hypothetical protein
MSSLETGTGGAGHRHLEVGGVCQNPAENLAVVWKEFSFDEACPKGQVAM